MAEEFSLSAKISGDTSELSEALGAGKDSLKEFGVDVDKVIQFLTNPTIGLAAAFAFVAVKGFESAKAFDEASATIAKGTGATGEALDSLNASLKNVVSSGIEQGIDDIANAVANLNVRLGLTGKPLEEATKKFGDFADATGQEAAKAVTDVTKLMAAWQIPAEGLSITLDKLTLISQNTGISAQNLTKIVQDAGPIFQAAGFSIDETLGIMAGFEKAGVEATVATQSINIALRNFSSDGVTDTKKALNDLIEEIQNTSDKSRATTLAVENFGKAGVTMATAIRSGALDIKKWTDQINGAEGALDRTSDAAENFEDMTKVLGNQLQGLLAESFNSVLEAVKPVLQIISSAIKTFESFPAPVKQIVEGLAILVGGLNVAKLAITAFGLSANIAMGPIGLIVGALGALFVVYQSLGSAGRTIPNDFERQAAALKKCREESDAIIGPINSLTEGQKLNAEQVEKLAKLYPDLNKELKENNLNVAEAQRLIENYANISSAASQIPVLMQAVQYETEKANASMGAVNVPLKLLKDTLATPINPKSTNWWEGFKNESEKLKAAREQLAAVMQEYGKYKSDTLNIPALNTADYGKAMKGSLNDIMAYIAKIKNESPELEKALSDLKKAQDNLANAKKPVDTKKPEIAAVKVLTDAEKKAAEERLKVQLELDAKNREIAKKWLEDHGVMVQMGSAFEVNEREKWLLKEEQFAEKDIALWGNAIETVSQTVSSSFAQTGTVFSSLSKLVTTLTSNIKTGVKDIGQFVSEMATQVSNSVNSIFGAIQKGYQQTLQAQQSAIDKQLAANKKALAKEQADIDKETKAKLKALGLEEKTAIEKDQAELASAIATGDAIAIKAAEDQLLKDRILQQGLDAKQAAAEKEAATAEELERKKSDLAFKSAHAQWELQGVQLAAASALAIMQLWAGTGTYVEKIVMSAVVGAIGIAEGAILAANEPKRASYAVGTYNSIGGAANLAEQGPELVINPSVHNLAKGSTVLNAAQTAKIMARKGPTINVNVGRATHGTVGEIARTVNMEARKLAFAGVL